MEHTMNVDILVIAYGDNTTQGRGLYRVTVNNNRLDVKCVYQCKEKPGAVISLGNGWLLSFRNEQRHSGIRVLVPDNNVLAVQKEYEIPYFISSFARLSKSNLLLGSSFYDGVDLTLSVEDPVQITSVSQHTYRPRSKDIRQSACHPHHIKQFFDEPWVYSVDMGTDSVSLYSLYNDTLDIANQWQIDTPLGSGPRIMRLAPNRRFAYLLNEIDNSIAVYAISHEEKTRRPVFQKIQRLPTILGKEESSAAGCVITEDGRFLLVSNRGEDSVVLFKTDPDSGTLTFCDRLYCARTPRDLFLIGYQVIIAAQDAHCLQLLCIDADSRTLRLIDEAEGIPQPVGFMQ
jgi:6-phosphogluconolactonase